MADKSIVRTNDNLSALRIDCEDWFKREDFIMWLERETNFMRQATWRVPGVTSIEYSDVFIVYDHDEGSGEDMPEDIYRRICEICESYNFTCGVIWITSASRRGNHAIKNH